MKALMKAGLLLCGLCLVPTEVSALQMDTDTFLKAYEHGNDDSKRTLLFVLAAEEDGMSWANASLMDARHEKPLYCLPDEMSLSNQRIMDVFQHYLAMRKARNPQEKLADLPLGAVLLLAFQNSYPCK